MTLQYQHPVHPLSASPSFPRTHPRLAGHRSPLDEIEIMSSNSKEVRYEDAPLDLERLTSLNASFGLLADNDGHDDDYGCSRDELDRQFELLYEMEEPSQQQKQHIHRTSHIPYKEQPGLYGHVKQRWSLQDDADGDDHTQLSSVDLNPYSAKIQRGDHQENNSSSFKERQLPRPQSIFRPTSSPLHKTQTAFDLPSPNAVMNRRVVHKALTVQTAASPDSTSSNRSQPLSPTHSGHCNTGTTPRPVGILRNPTAVSSFTQTTVASPATLSSASMRSRSVSRRRQGRSASRSKSRSRRSNGGDGHHQRENVEYHESLFRGAQLIKEQLLRSMADVDREREREDVLLFRQVDARLAKARAKGDAVGDTRGMSCEKPTMTHFEEDDLATVDFDYSGGALPTEQSLVKSPSRSMAAVGQQSHPVVACNSMTPSSVTASTVSQRLESESRRLDNLVKIFAKTSSVSSSTPSLIPSPSSGNNPCHNGNKQVGDEKSSSSDKENEEYPRDEMNVREEDHPVKNVNKLDSPKSSCVELNHVTTSNEQAFLTQSCTNDDSVGFGYAKQYLEDTTKHAPAEGLFSQSDLQLQYQQPQQQQYRSQEPMKQHPAEEALSHARAAGPLWRSLVGNHVRFPYAWDSILPSTSPPVGRPNLKWSKWFYVARHRVRGDRKLNSREYGVRSRRSGGRILLNIVVRDMHTTNVSREIAIGCFHPNAKGIRKGDPSAEVEEVREVWMAVRWVIGLNCTEPDLGVHHYEEDIECFLDSFLTQKRQVLDYHTMGSPLGHRKAVSNENVRAVFGDQPPLQMVDLQEDELAEILKANDYKRLSGLPGLMLLKLFLFSK